MTHPRIAAAIRTQLDNWRAALRGGAERVGWKLGLSIAEVEELIGVEPVIGHLTTATLLPDGGTYATSDSRLRGETELAIEVGPDLTVAGLAVALELVDVARPPGGMEAIVATNVFHRAFALGPTTSERPGRAHAIVNGELRASEPVTGDHAETIRAVSDLLEAAGERLQPGDRILSGSFTHVPVGPGDHVVAEIDGLGRVSARIDHARAS